jgi:hypothetical protein
MRHGCTGTWEFFPIVRGSAGHVIGFSNDYCQSFGGEMSAVGDRRSKRRRYAVCYLQAYMTAANLSDAPVQALESDGVIQKDESDALIQTDESNALVQPDEFGAPVQADESESDAMVQADEGTQALEAVSDSVNAELLQGLGALADLLSDASETLNQCLVTIEDTLNGLSPMQEEWVPIQTTRSSVECVQPEAGEQPSQECVFGGVPVTILKLAVPASQEAGTQWEYQLGYSRVGAGWALMVRTARFQPSNGHEGFCQFSDLKPLREAPLEIRLKGIREIPSLIKLLDSRGLAMA